MKLSGKHAWVKSTPGFECKLGASLGGWLQEAKDVWLSHTAKMAIHACVPGSMTPSEQAVGGVGAVPSRQCCTRRGPRIASPLTLVLRQCSTSHQSGGGNCHVSDAWGPLPASPRHTDHRSQAVCTPES